MSEWVLQGQSAHPLPWCAAPLVRERNAQAECRGLFEQGRDPGVLGRRARAGVDPPIQVLEGP